ncbi:unnamed protein product [Arctogadus glacialis]
MEGVQERGASIQHGGRARERSLNTTWRECKGEETQWNPWRECKGEETQYSSFAVSIYFPELVTSPIKGFAEVPPHCSFGTPLNQAVIVVAGGVWHTLTPGSHGGGRWSLAHPYTR